MNFLVNDWRDDHSLPAVAGVVPVCFLGFTKHGRDGARPSNPLRPFL
ncbi:hypothetical protein BH20VER3_BH20VER3_01050 [soil metagenome]